MLIEKVYGSVSSFFFTNVYTLLLSLGCWHADLQ
jgi:hypothetical protein